MSVYLNSFSSHINFLRKNISLMPLEKKVMGVSLLLFALCYSIKSYLFSPTLKVTLDDGTTLIGKNIKDGKLNGPGEITSPKYIKCKGVFDDNLLHGYGEVILSDHKKYKGIFNKGSLETGVITFPNFTKSNGTFIKDPDGNYVAKGIFVKEPDGTLALTEGKIIYPDGEKQRGKFAKDPDGKYELTEGTITHPDGYKETGKFIVKAGALVLKEGTITHPDGTERVVKPE